MTQAEFATGICTASAISQMEADKIVPSVETILLLAKRLQFPVEQLIHGEDFTFLQENVVLAMDLIEKRHYGEAITLFESIVESNLFAHVSSRKHILYNLACCYIEQCWYDKAIPLLEEITRDKVADGFYTDDILLSDAYRALAACHENKGLYRAYHRVYGDLAAEILNAQPLPAGRPALRVVKGGA